MNGMNGIFRLPTDDEVAAFRKEGVVHLRSAFFAAAFARLVAGVEDIVRVEDSSGRATRGSSFFVQRSYAWRESADLRDFLFECGVGQVCGVLLEASRPQLYEDSILVKEPGSVKETPWHQDLVYYPLAGEQLCTIWIPLDPVVRENGACRYVAGSHRWGTRYAPVRFSTLERLDSGELPAIEEAMSRVTAESIVHFDSGPGDCIVHHGLTIHGAFGNRSATAWRRAYAISVFGEQMRLSRKSFTVGDQFEFRDGDLPPSERFPFFGGQRG